MELYVPDSTVFIVKFWQKFMRQLVELVISNKTEENVSLTDCSAKQGYIELTRLNTCGAKNVL